MSFTPEEKQQLLNDVAVTKTKVEYIHEDIKPEVKKNTRFRLYITGFILISVPLIGVIMKLAA